MATDNTKEQASITEQSPLLGDEEATGPAAAAPEATTAQPKSSGGAKRVLAALGLIVVGVVIVLAIALPLVYFAGDGGDEPSTMVGRVLDRVPLIDGHNNLAKAIRKNVQNNFNKVDLTKNLTDVWPSSNTDIPRLRAGRVGGVFWSCNAECDTQYTDAVRVTLDQCDTIHRFVDKYPDTFQFVDKADDIQKAFDDGKIASMLCIEGGHSMDSSLATLRMFYRMGVRYMSLAYFCTNPWADCSFEDEKQTPDYHGGLTDWGKTVVKEMNRLGMLVDLSHASKSTMLDVLKVTEAPVLFSHSSAYTLCNHHRNVQDDVLEMLTTNGGMVMATFFTDYINCYPNKQDVGTLSQVADHLDYIRNISGVDHVGIGSDFDGIASVPEGLEDVSKYPDLLHELAERGWTEDDLGKLAGNNLIRVLKRAEEVRDKLADEGVQPYDDTIPETDLPAASQTCRLDF